MTQALVKEPAAPRVGRHRKRPSWLQVHARSLCALIATLVLVTAAMAYNLGGYPGRQNDDEGIYIARAWAMLAEHHLANYTYFWDHPFFGWSQIAGWNALIDGFTRQTQAILVGRQFMCVVCLISCALIFAFARRLGMRRISASAAVLLFGLSPLDIWYHRMISLDNLTTVWLLGAMVCAASRKRGLAAVFGAAACFAGAFWSKETTCILLPVVAWLLWQHNSEKVRLKYLSCFAMLSGGLIALYPLLAAIKGELLPGPGHVSLVGTEISQFTRMGTGSLLSPSSGTALQVHSWIVLDPWFVYLGALAMVAGFTFKQLRPLSLGLLIQFGILVKGGYVPYWFVTTMIPFAALLIPGIADSCLRPFTTWRQAYDSKFRRIIQVGLPILGRLVTAGAIVVFLSGMMPSWIRSLGAQARANGFAGQDAAITWIAQNVPKGGTVLCDGYPWVDIELHTKATPVYLWQVDSDPEVMRNQLPKGYASIDYMLLNPASPLTFDALPGRPTLKGAFKHSVVIKRFTGGLIVYKVTRSD